MGKLKVTVDSNKCVGSRLCMMFSPELFKLDEHGQSSVIERVEPERNQVLSTAEQCPQCAIKVEDIESGDVLFPPPELTF